MWKPWKTSLGLVDLRGVEKCAEIEHQKSICRYSVFKKGGEEHCGDSGTPWYPMVPHGFAAKGGSRDHYQSSI